MLPSSLCLEKIAKLYSCSIIAAAFTSAAWFGIESVDFQCNLPKLRLLCWLTVNSAGRRPRTRVHTTTMVPAEYSRTFLGIYLVMGSADEYLSLGIFILL